MNEKIFEDPFVVNLSDEDLDSNGLKCPKRGNIKDYPELVNLKVIRKIMTNDNDTVEILAKSEEDSEFYLSSRKPCEKKPGFKAIRKFTLLLGSLFPLSMTTYVVPENLGWN